MNSSTPENSGNNLSQDLHIAILKGDDAKACTLIEQAPVNYDFNSYNSMTFLERAVQESTNEAAKKLYKVRNANILRKNASLPYVTALHFAIRRCNLELANIFMEGEKKKGIASLSALLTTQESQYGTTPLHYALYLENASVNLDQQCYLIFLQIFLLSSI